MSAISLTATRSGRLDSVVAELRDIPTRVIPYAANGALNIVAKRARDDIKAQMPRVFDRPNAYTINSLRVVESKRETLTARIAVKDSAASGGVRPESYLFPSVFSGSRKAKRFEQALRYAGALPSTQFAVPGVDAPLDRFGNVSAALVRQILKLAEQRGYSPESVTGRSSIRLTNRSSLFVGTPSVGRGSGRRDRRGARAGIYRREGKRLRPLFIFTSNVPDYRARLPFAEIAERRAEADFRTEFARIANSILSRPR